MWFYEILGSGNRVIEQSKGCFATENEAIAAGKAYLEHNRDAVVKQDPREVFSIMAGRK